MKAQRPHSFALFTAILTAALLAAVVLAVCVGKYPVTPKESIRILWESLTGTLNGANTMTVNVVIGLRVPRILTSVVVGAALSVSGAVYQGIFNNPLISPDFLGVSSGACVGAALAILLSLAGGMIQLFAFAGGVLAVLLALLIPGLLRNRSNIMLVLSGIIVGAAMSSVLGFIKYVADPETQLAAITYWTMGSFSYIKLPELFGVLPAIVIPAIALYLLSWRIDILSMGSDDAKALGVNVPLVRTVAILCATLMTASSVCLAGTISWVGLVVPHFGRMLVGPSHRRLLPVTALLGGLFMLAVDTLTRTIGAAEMPVSILTGVIGAPLYAFFLYRERRRMA
ncbi:MAG: iron ABC transporter permease [Eubacteriales bacterium]|nr:iron ABC transporter permease [Eubacteriales bacterium]